MSTRYALLVAIIAALGATSAAAAHASPAAIAWLAAAAAAAVAVAAGAAARALRAPDDLREPRHARGPSQPEPLPADAVSRGVFGRMWAYAAGAFVVLAAVPFVALARRPAPRGTAWSAGARVVDTFGRALRADDIAVGGVATVFPEHNVGAPESATLLIRLQDDALRTRPDRVGWAPHGNVAYSKICTHAGCPVAIYRHESYQLYCPCHQSVFDVLDAARPISGPATRALPQLALDVDAHGYLVARGDYGEPVGPDDWWRTV
jgi:ubiquinol-cytochrome c reductase iron-sulfur subunit